MLQIVRQLAWMILRCVLPYPDLARRARIRRDAFRLVTRNPWPGEGATGTDAAHLALLRTLWLQRETRRAVRSRRDEAAALLARAALEAYILGAYCLYAEDAVKILVAADNRAMRRVPAYFTEDDLLSLAAINDAADVIGAPGRDLKFAEAAEWLEREHGFGVPLRRVMWVGLTGTHTVAGDEGNDDGLVMGRHDLVGQLAGLVRELSVIEVAGTSPATSRSWVGSLARARARRSSGSMPGHRRGGAAARGCC